MPQRLNGSDNELGEGLRFTAPDGSFLDILAAQPGQQALVALERDLDEEDRLWSCALPAELPATLRPERGHEQFAAVGPGVVLRLSVPSGPPITQALRSLSDANPGLMTPRLALLCLLGMRAGRGTVPAERWGRAFLVLRRMPFTAEWTSAATAAPLLPAALIEQMVAGRLTVSACLAGRPVLERLHSLDVARVTLELARQMWQTDWGDVEVLRALARSGMRSHEQRDHMVSLMLFGSAWLMLRSQMTVTIAGVELRVPEDPAHYMNAWTVAHIMPSIGVDAAAIRALIPDGLLPQPSHAWIDAVTDADPALLRGLAVGLVRDASLLAAYAPEGTFEVELPEGLGLRAFGLTGLRLHVTRNRLFVRALDPKPNGPIHSWDPSHYPSSEADFQASRDRVPTLWRQWGAWVDVVCAALWHDLHVAGETSLRPLARTRARWRGGSSNPPTVPLEPVEVQYLDLPRRLSLSGAREWGSAEEREQIRLRMHGVAGHLRRLAENWSRSMEAEEAARAYGVVLPDGYTFVRPFVRGGEGGEEDAAAPPRIVVRSRGLASLVSLGGRMIRRP